MVHRDRKRKREHKRQKVIRVIEENASRGYTDCNGDFEIEPYTARDYDYLNFCIKKQVVLYSTKEGYVFQDDINSKVLGFAFGLMAEIERNLISMRTKEALARRKQEGMTLGRKKGDTPKIKLLHANKRVLTKELDKGTTYSELAEKMGVSRTTLFRFMKTMY